MYFAEKMKSPINHKLNYTILVCVFVVYVYAVGTTEFNVDILNIKITGPGIRPEKIVLPARYFYIYLYQNKEKRYDPLLAGKLKVEVNGRNNHDRECRVWVNVLDRRDGSYIARYKLYETCYSVQITVKFNGDHVGGSPFNIKKPVQPEDCPCPVPFDEWLEYNECPSNYAQIDNDLQAFPTVNFSTFHEHVVQRVDNSGSMSVCNYLISNNEIYRKCYGEHVGFKMFVDSVLLSLARKIRLPDTELFVNLGDWPLAKRDADKLFPMFSWCGSKSTLDIVMPTYDLTESSLEMMARVSLDMLSVQGNIERAWKEKEPKAFWRGRDSSRERLKLMEIAREHPDLFNVSMTNYFFFREQEKVYGKSKHVSFFRFFDYKYQVCLDGTVAAYRLPYLLAGDALVLKQDSDYYEYFYSDLKAWLHFVPVKRDLSDLVEKVRWARDNDAEARKIVLAGQEYARNNLLPQNVLCYHAVLLNEWSRRVVGDVKLREEMDKVPQPKSGTNCVCPSSGHDEL